MRDLLLAPLPPEALKQHPTRTYLTTINAIYVTERFNDVFGLAGWSTKVDVIKDDGEWVVVLVHFTAEYFDEDGIERTIRRNAFGGNDNDDIGDRYKGAVTDALTKIGSMLGVGVAVWMNQKPQPVSARPTETKSPQQVAQRSNTAVPQGEPEEWLNVLSKDGRMTTLGLEYAERVYAQEMTVKDIRKLFKVSKASAEALENWRPTRPNPVGNYGTNSETNQAQFDDDGLPF